MGDLSPHTGTAPVPADDDNRYKAVQAKLGRLAKAMDDAVLELDALRRDMKANAAQATDVAGDIDHAELDPVFVIATNEVATALGGAAIEVKNLAATAEEIVDSAHRAQRTHSQLYGALDDIRSNRQARTPRPAFFNR
ncbi:conjugal transfer protein TraB [Streptomyces sp. NPDC101175]|uniref:conjugal transfer protein TraB n=1 Tax=Streptomyces sp. NPDC101175 TaxID=3366123 RepID=UPI0038367D10